MVTNSKILVAGGTGFIGSNLISELVANGNKVISISKSEKKIKKTLKNVTYIIHDLNVPIKKDEFNCLSDIDYFINCSGYIDHRSFEDGGDTIFINHFKKVYFLTSLAIELNVKAFIQIGSSDEYGQNKCPITETSRESPVSPYALGKLTTTHYLQQCFRKGILNTIILRPFLVYGENQNKDRFLPYIIEKCIKNKDFKVSKGEQIRDYLYIKDFNLALIKSLINPKAYGEVINIASGIPISIKEVIYNVRGIIGKGNPIIGGIDYRDGESMELYANINKAKLILDWEPRYEFKKTLKKVIKWYEENE